MFGEPSECFFLRYRLTFHMLWTDTSTASVKAKVDKENAPTFIKSKGTGIDISTKSTATGTGEIERELEKITTTTTGLPVSHSCRVAEATKLVAEETKLVAEETKLVAEETKLAMA